jgi:tripartite motif-containing protein 2/3/tripartite motif-containing protein 71
MDSVERSSTEEAAEPCADPKSSAKQSVVCQVCTETNAHGCCKDCNKCVCKNCFQLHNKFPPFSTHKFVSFEEAAIQSPVAEDALTMTCSKHDDPLRVFCETCQELICRDCTIHTHKDHDYDLVSGCYNKHHQILQTTLNAIKKQKNDLMIKITALANRKNEIKDQGELVKQEINLMADEMVDVIRQSAKNLTEEVDSATDNKLQVVTLQKESAEIAYSHLEDCSRYVKQSLETNTHQQILSSKKEMMDQMNHIMEDVKAEDYEPVEMCDVQFVRNKEIKVNHIGEITFTSGLLHQCKVKLIDEVAYVNKTFSFPLLIESSKSMLNTVPPQPSLKCSVTCTCMSTTSPRIDAAINSTNQPGVYKVRCTPVIRGKYEVTVQVSGLQLESVSVVVPFNSYHNTFTPMYTIEEIEKPFGVAVCNDHLIVAENIAHLVEKIDKIYVAGRRVLAYARSRFVCQS